MVRFNHLQPALHGRQGQGTWNGANFLPKVGREQYVPGLTCCVLRRSRLNYQGLCQLVVTLKLEIGRGGWEWSHRKKRPRLQRLPVPPASTTRPRLTPLVPSQNPHGRHSTAQGPLSKQWGHAKCIICASLSLSPSPSLPPSIHPVGDCEFQNRKREGIGRGI